MKQSGDRVIGSSGHRGDRNEGSGATGCVALYWGAQHARFSRDGVEILLPVPRMGSWKNSHRQEYRRHTALDESSKSSSQKKFAFLRDVARQAARRVRVASQIILTTLLEIFDENAYQRFLGQTCAVRSAESYKAFLRERECEAARRPKCC